MQLLHTSNLIGFRLLTRSGDVIHPQLCNFGSGYETAAAKKSMKVTIVYPYNHSITLQNYLAGWQYCLKIQFTLKQQCVFGSCSSILTTSLLFLLSVHMVGCVYCCFINLRCSRARNKNYLTRAQFHIESEKLSA